MKRIKWLIKKGFNFIGLDIRRFNPTDNQLYWLNNHNIRTVFDIGANIGQYALKIHQTLPKATIYSFEPLKDCYERLLENMKHVKSFKAFNIALGEKNMESKIYRSSYSPSSSLLKMALLHKKAFPHTKETTEEKILVKRLDDAVKGLSLRKNILIKMDVEGYEDKVIVGGINLISQAKVIIIETSFKPLHLNQPLFGQIYEILKKLKFEYAGSLGQKKNPANGNALLNDSVFINRNL